MLNTLHRHQHHAAPIYIYIYQCLGHVAHRNINIHFVWPAAADYSTILQELTDRNQNNKVHTDCLLRMNMDFRENPFNGSRNKAPNLEDLSKKLVLNMDRTKIKSLILKDYIAQ